MPKSGSETSASRALVIVSSPSRSILRRSPELRLRYPALDRGEPAGRALDRPAPDPPLDPRPDRVAVGPRLLEPHRGPVAHLGRSCGVAPPDVPPQAHVL